MIPSKESVKLFCNIPIFEYPLTLNADNSCGDFFKIDKIIGKFIYSEDIEYDNIIDIVVSSFSEEEKSTKLRKKVNTNVLIISDLSSLSGSSDKVREFEKCLTKFSLNVYIFGAELNNQSCNASQLGTYLLQIIPQERCFSLDRSNDLVKYFMAPVVRAINSKINFEIDRDCFIPLQGYVNHVRISDKFSIKKIIEQESSKLLKKGYMYKNDEGEKIEFDYVIDAHRYGNQLIPFNFFDQPFHSIELDEKSLKLLQFAPRNDIDICYLEPPIYHYFIDKSDYDLGKRGEELIKGMIERDVVAIGSRTLSKNSKPKLVVIFPAISKSTSEPILITFISVFKESLKFSKFPLGEKVIESLTTREVALMDSYVDMMTLESHDNRYKPENTVDPFYQNKLSIILEKATRENIYDKSYIENILNLDSEKIEKCKNIEKKISDHYNL
uniref:Ku domain-containing protein n=1 Tax=Strongyloides venezuelensis TaxID=75913 RepID=A0A0K0FA90_STRVS